MPTTLAGVACGVLTDVTLPTTRAPSSADRRSMTISTGWPAATETGGRPSTISKAFSSLSSIQLIAMVGGPSPPRSVPSAATIWAVPSITG